MSHDPITHNAGKSRHFRAFRNIWRSRRIQIVTFVSFGFFIASCAAHYYDGGFWAALVIFIDALAPNLLASIVFFLLVAEGVKALLGIRIQDNRDNESVLDLFRQLSKKDKIDILDISLLSHLDMDYERREFLSQLREVVTSKQVTVRLLLANPDSAPAKFRARDLGLSETEYLKKLTSSLNHLSTFLSENEVHRNRVKIRLFSTFARVAYYGFGRQVAAAVYPSERKTNDAPNLIFHDNEFQRYFLDHFEEMWKESGAGSELTDFRKAKCVASGSQFEVWFVNHDLPPASDSPHFPSRLSPRYILCQNASILELEKSSNNSQLIQIENTSGIYSPNAYRGLIDEIVSLNSKSGRHGEIEKFFDWMASLDSKSATFAVLCEVAETVKRNGFCISKSERLARMLTNADFSESWNNLPIDEFYQQKMLARNLGSNPVTLSHRSRKIGRYDLVWDGISVDLTYLNQDESSEFHHRGKTLFYQPREINKFAGGEDRWFTRIDENIANNHIKDIVSADFLRIVANMRPATKQRKRKWSVTVHQIRVTCSFTEEVAEPAPEGIHCDGHDYLVIHVIARENILGNSGMNSIYTRDSLASVPAKPTDSWCLEKGQSLFINDREVLHCVSSFRPLDRSKPSYRDVLLIDFDRVDNYEHCS